MNNQDTQNGIISTFTGIPIIVEKNGDLIFRCGSTENAKQTLREIVHVLERKPHDN